MTSCVCRLPNFITANLNPVGAFVVRQASHHLTTTALATLAVVGTVAVKSFCALRASYNTGKVPFKDSIDALLFIDAPAEGGTSTTRVPRFQCSGFCTLKNAAIATIALAALAIVYQRCYRA